VTLETGIILIVGVAILILFRKDIDRWWFGRGSPVTLGLFRIAMGLIAFASMGLVLFDFEAWFTEKGFLPLSVAQQWAHVDFSFDLGQHAVQLPFDHLPRVNIFGIAADSRVALALYLLVMLSALTTALGLWTRVSTIILAIGMVSIHHRNPIILHSGDTLMRLCVIYLAWAPSGAACSYDRVIALWKGRAPAEPKPISLWGQRLIQFQVAIVYFTTVWWKWFGIYWKDGTATWYPENLNEFNRFPVPEFIRHQPFIAFTTYGTLVVELSLATLVFYKPLRKYVLLAGIAMHGYIEYRFNIPFFAFTIIATYICFYDGEEVVAWSKKIAERMRRWRLLVETPLGFRLKPAPELALKAMDPFDLISYDTGASPDWKAMTIVGKPRPPFFGSYIRCIGAWPSALFWKRMLKRALERASGVDAEPTLPRSVAEAKSPKR